MVPPAQQHSPPPRHNTPTRWFHLLAGPNGAGKSTLYRALVREGILGPPLEFVNADLYEQAHLQHMADPEARSEAARQWADARRTALMNKGADFASETVFSHPSKLALIEEAQRCGYTVALYIVTLDDPARLLQRVAQRVREGGPPYRPNASWPATPAPWTTWPRQCGRPMCRICMTPPKPPAPGRNWWRCAPLPGPPPWPNRCPPGRNA